MAISTRKLPHEGCPAVEQVDNDNRDLAVAIAKLSVTIEHLDTRVDRVDKTLDGFNEFTRKLDGMIAQMIRVESMIGEARAQNQHIETLVESLEGRIDRLETQVNGFKTAMRWLAGILALLIAQFSEQLVNLVFSKK